MFDTVEVQKSVPSTISMEVICKKLCMYKDGQSFSVIFIRRYIKQNNNKNTTPSTGHAYFFSDYDT